MPFKAIIHVAGISMLWRSSERSIRSSVRNAIHLARTHGFRTIAVPLIGAGAGGGREEEVLEVMRSELSHLDFEGEVRIVQYARTSYPGEYSRRKKRRS